MIIYLHIICLNLKSNFLVYVIVNFSSLCVSIHKSKWQWSLNKFQRINVLFNTVSLKKKCWIKKNQYFKIAKREVQIYICIKILTIYSIMTVLFYLYIVLNCIKQYIAEKYSSSFVTFGLNICLCMHVGCITQEIKRVKQHLFFLLMYIVIGKYLIKQNLKSISATLSFCYGLYISWSSLAFEIQCRLHLLTMLLQCFPFSLL